MKSHPVKLLPAFYGENSTDPDDRIPDEAGAQLWGCIAEPTGRISKWGNFYIVTTAEALGVLNDAGKQKVWTLARFKGKTGQSRLLGVIGGTLLRTGPNNIYDPWVPIDFPVDIVAPALNRPCAIAYRSRFGYVFNIEDMPFRIKMEEDDGSSPTTTAEPLGLRAPLSVCYSGTDGSAGTRFPDNRQTAYAVTFVYGTRGESGPSPIVTYEPSADRETIALNNIPVGPSGVTARRIYRSRIGAGSVRVSSDPKFIDWPASPEMFLLSEIQNNLAATYTDNADDSKLDYSTRMPPPRPFPPRAKYCVVHQDRFAWAHLREHPWAMLVCSVEGNGSLTAATISISNTGNGTITLKHNIGAGLVTAVTISDYKTKTLSAIRSAVMGGTYSNQVFTAGFQSGTNFFARVASGVDDTRTYRFAEVTDQNIYKNANVYGMVSIDDADDAVVVDGSERFPNRLMWSDVTFPEEINPLQSWDAARHDAYPITGMFHDDYTLGLSTEDTFFVLTGSLSVNEFYEPDFTVSRTQSEHGSICTRPDAMAWTPIGILFLARDGFRIFRGQSSTRWKEGRQLNKRVMKRLKVDPRARDNFLMHYHDGVLYGFFAGEEVA